VSAVGPAAAVAEEVVRRVVEVASPEKIILFGSAARGEAARESDVDLLVVKAGADPLEVARRIYRHLFGVGAAVDWVAVTPEDAGRYRDGPALVIKHAVAEGRVVYEAERVAEAQRGAPTPRR
jgi:predicted nucleotidyltransferase